ncbi:hypothetical protein VP01_2056g3 [Puccinia sorghi]|uniref:Uncharacterized protein n=1 Tax=Puccinia sorghi TaxID=27349 RepID=A0A0L6VAY6_9BASI|nr:hypothetical protein VP01_2056g3 [Puccinia sorghi]
MPAVEAWAFGSNLFNQLDPDENNNNNKKKKIANLLKHFPNNLIKSFHVLHLADSQTLVQYTTNEEPEQACLEIWGFNEDAPMKHRQRVADGALSHPLDQIQEWHGRTTIVGYLSRDGTLRPFAMSSHDEEKPAAPGINIPRYRTLTISDNGQVLAAPLDASSSSHTHHSFQLWSSFHELLMPGAKPIRSFNLIASAGETEIQLSSGAAHFLILTHTPIAVDGEYHSSVYGFGDNRFGQIGIGTRSAWVEEPQKLETLEGTMRIDCGLLHSVAVGGDGTLYTFGDNRKGQCGVVDSNANTPLDTAAPVLVDLGGNGQAGTIIDVRDARCGSQHTAALAHNGLWLTGSS